MILVDANLLLYARVSSYAERTAAKSWIDGQLASGAAVGLPWESLNAFMRIASNGRLFPQPLSVAEAWSQVRDWLANSAAWTPQAGPKHLDIMDRLIAGRRFSTKLVSDVHLAAIAIEHDLTVCSADADFGRFDGVRWLNPIRV